MEHVQLQTKHWKLRISSFFKKRKKKIKTMEKMKAWHGFLFEHSLIISMEGLYSIISTFFEGWCTKSTRWLCYSLWLPLQHHSDHLMLFTAFNHQYSSNVIVSLYVELHVYHNLSVKSKKQSFWSFSSPTLSLSVSSLLPFVHETTHNKKTSQLVSTWNFNISALKFFML